MKKLFSLLVLMLVPSSVHALESSETFYGMNQMDGVEFYNSYLKSDSAWSVRAKDFLDLYNREDFYGFPIALDSVVTGEGGDAFYTRLSIPEDVKLVSSGGYVVSDELCAGDKLTVQGGLNRGEFWQDGGDLDSPPIYWVNDVPELVYSLVKNKMGIYKAGREVYPNKPFRLLFKVPPSFLYEYTPSYQDKDSETIVTSREQQERFREYLKEMGYSKIYEDLANAEYTVRSEEVYPSRFIDVISIKKEGKEIGSIREMMPNISNLPDDYFKSGYVLNHTSSFEAEVIMDGRDIAYWPLVDTYYDCALFEGKREVQVYAEDVILRDGDIDPLTGIPIYRYYNMGWGASYVDVGMACSTKENDATVQGMVKDGKKGQYTVTGKDSARYTANQDVECTYYFYGIGNPTDQNASITDFCTPFYTLMQMPSIRMPDTWTDDAKIDQLFTVGSIVVDKPFIVVEPAKPKVEVSVVDSDIIKFGESNTLRLLVKNEGDVNVSIKSVYSNPEGKLISCDSENLAPGQQAECLLSVTPVQGQGLSVEVSYDYKSCGKSQVGLVTKTLIDFITVHPVLKEQSYLMGVHGACDNSYFSCYSASEGSLFAGYKCFKTATGFYAPATERFNLRFDLSDIPKNAEILGAKLFLKASDVGGKQTVNVHAVNKIPEVVKCLPGGDICTKPYCGECKPLYDLDGTIASSAEVSSAGQYSFDVTDLLKNKIAGDGVVSLQIRGNEGLWESLGQSSCTIENDWDKRDISFDAGGRDGPYLEVVYR